MSEQPKIYGAVYQILSELNVAKTGTLPGNMGGKNYQTAEAVANEVKKLFVEHKIVFESHENVEHIDTPDFGDKRSRFMITIKGSYTLTHIEDGSQMTGSGIGQGLATGTAVAANIASTFALKNALQRMFLISEEAVDVAGHVTQAEPKQTTAQRQVASIPQPQKVSPNYESEMFRKVGALMRERNITSERVNEVHAEVAKETGKNKDDCLDELYERLQAEGVN